MRHKKSVQEHRCRYWNVVSQAEVSRETCLGALWRVLEHGTLRGTPHEACLFAHCMSSNCRTNLEKLLTAASTVEEEKKPRPSTASPLQINPKLP